MTALPDLPRGADPARASSSRTARRRLPLGPTELVAAALLSLLVVMAVAPGLLAPADPLAVSPTDAFAGPSLTHPFGTDESGRGVWTRVVHGAGASLTIGLVATMIGTGLGVVLGVLAGLGGRGLVGRATDAGVSRVLEVLFALPGLLLALVVIAFTGPGAVPATIAVGLATAPGYARIVRSQVAAVRRSPMVEAATVLGRRPGLVLVRHVLPNALAPVVVLATLGLGQAVVWASSLSYLGLGSPPPAPEWGAMLSAGRTYLAVAWWMTVFPGLAVVVTAASATVLGRGLARRGRGGRR
ncbi:MULTISPECIES: ABC transporter permease [unclassified Frigoribacterium]|uniref:ABC transporter permease n=1 Tax=unclassified Frigoribacterium TaxID=2627005 RepID=UPI001565D2A3|nr:MULTISPECIES: ABC transporter permease [unclassified Frigoribacterium]MBD8141802.1 ABC transporter permease [Frigoribacterium sp. CFBP 13605]NQW88516.1 ABC transporter permease [Frigoribacterium sp. VKM Ac-2860]NQX08675.1 ABC transporter permease [Frigoribacterium sp. VKM Ac-2859]